MYLTLRAQSLVEPRGTGPPLAVYDLGRDPFEQTLRRSAGLVRWLEAGAALSPKPFGRRCPSFRCLRDGGEGGSAAPGRLLYRHPLPGRGYPKSLRPLRGPRPRGQLGPSVPDRGSVQCPGRRQLGRHQHDGHAVDRARRPPALPEREHPPQLIRHQLRQGPDSREQWILRIGSGRQPRRSLRSDLGIRSAHRRRERVLRSNSA